MFFIVYFHKENTVEGVPKHWLKKGNKSEKRGSSYCNVNIPREEIDNLIINCRSINFNKGGWKKYPCRVIREMPEFSQAAVEEARDIYTDQASSDNSNPGSSSMSSKNTLDVPVPPKTLSHVHEHVSAESHQAHDARVSSNQNLPENSANRSQSQTNGRKRQTQILNRSNQPKFARTDNYSAENNEVYS